MATDYPDIIGEYIHAPKRFEVGGLQYAGAFEPKQIKIGQTANLHLYLQNVLDVPLTIQVKPIIPQVGRIRKHPLLSLSSTQIELSMGKAEAGRLTIPVTTSEQAVSGKHQLGVEFKVQHSKKASQIRRSKLKDPLGALPIDDRIGLDLVSIVGASYSLQKGKKAKFLLTLSKTQEVVEPSDQGLDYSYQKLWDLDTAQTQHYAQIEINKTRAQILDDLQIEPLFVSLYAENKQRFLDAGMSLHPGEAIALAKLMTYTAHYFLSRGELQDGLLCPIWERALFNDFSVNNTLELIKTVGYRHILRLSIAFSFGMVTQAKGKQLWTAEERRGVMDYLINALEGGSPLEVDFLYLPLMMGALNVARQVRLTGEDVDKTVQLIKMARKARQDLFVGEEMKEANDTYAWLLKKL